MKQSVKEIKTNYGIFRVMADCVNVQYDLFGEVCHYDLKDSDFTISFVPFGRNGVVYGKKRYSDVHLAESVIYSYDCFGFKKGDL